MFDPQKMLGQLLQSQLLGSGGKHGKHGKHGKDKHRHHHHAGKSSGLGGLLSGGNPLDKAASALSGNKAMVGLGLLGVAFAAYDHYQQQQKPAPGGASLPPPPPPGPAPMPGAVPGWSTPMPPAAPPMPARFGSAPPMPPPGPPPAADSSVQDAMLLIRTMIAAAAADGHIDATERAAILERAISAGLDADSQRTLLAELNAPAGIDVILAGARADLAPAIYGAARLAITVDTEAERLWLERLVAGLGLSAAQRAHVDAQLAELSA
ncbi:MAG: tellurite resistance TerB family protein [Xanthomonadales bacterium]|jgi:uncharacterized membrane protein YebE (DUF533 family)|nr:tellurite resistance TerB family protein [Xanthomonadales bacterium]